MTTEVLRIELQDTGGPQTRDSLNKTGDSVEGLRGRVTGLTSVLGGYRTVLTAIVTGAAARFVTSTLSQIDSIGKLSDKIGVGVEALSEYRQVAALADVEFNTFTKALETSTLRISEAATGSGAAKDALAELQIPIQQLSRMAPEDQFEAITDAMQSVEGQSNRLRLAYDIFGRSGTDVLRIINQGTDAINEQREAFSEMGGTLTRDQVDAAAAANDAIERLTRAFTSLFETVVLLIAEPLTRLIDAITTIIGWFRRAITAVKDFGKAIRDSAIGQFFGLAQAAETAEDGIKSVTGAINESTGAVKDHSAATNAAAASTEDWLKPMEAVESQQVVLVDLTHQQATEALLLEQALQRQALAERQAAEEARKSSAAMRERAQATTALVGSVATLAGVVTPTQVGSLLTAGQSLGTLFGISGDQLAALSAAASVGAVGGAVVGGGGVGSAIGGALGAAGGMFLGGVGGAAIGSVLGGLVGGAFDSDNQPSVTFATLPGTGQGLRGRIGQNTFQSESALGLNVIGARDGGRLQQAQIDFINLFTALDDSIAGFVDGQSARLEAARQAAQAVSNETNAANFDPAENIRIRFQAIFDAIGGVESQLFDAFSPSGDFVPQVVAAIEILKDLGDTSQTVATGWDETNAQFLSAVGSLRLIRDAIDQEDPIAKIRFQIEELSLSTTQLATRSAQALTEQARAYDGSIEQTNQMATSLAALEQATAAALQGIDRAREASTAATTATAERIRQSGLTAQEIFGENVARATALRTQLETGGFTSSEAIADAISEINRLVSQGFFGLSPEERDAERQAQIDLLETSQEAANRQFEAQEARLRREHEAALEAADRGIDAAAALVSAANALQQAANDLSDTSEVA